METSPLFYKAATLSTIESALHPTLVFLHGRGADENDLLDLAQYFDPHFLIISVRALYRFPYGGYTWFNLDQNGTVNIDQLVNSRDALLRCLDDIQLKYHVDQSRLFLFGFSMGAIMSLTVSLSHPDRFKGVVSHSGMLPQHERVSYRWNDLSNTSFFIAHGEHDPIVPVELGRQAYQRLMQANANVLFRQYSIQHAIGEESLNDIVKWLQEQI
jgi:phospholipase/carboxylesterase